MSYGTVTLGNFAVILKVDCPSVGHLLNIWGVILNSQIEYLSTSPISPAVSKITGILPKEAKITPIITSISPAPIGGCNLKLQNYTPYIGVTVILE